MTTSTSSAIIYDRRAPKTRVVNGRSHPHKLKFSVPVLLSTVCALLCSHLQLPAQSDHKMASSDPHQGGDLSDMAATGTKIPNDAGEYNVLPSVPRPDQLVENQDSTQGGTDLAGAADNGSDIPRQHQDIGATGEVITGTGDALPAEVESKRLHFGANNPSSKGHDRDDKHSKQKESDLERYAGDGAEVDVAPGEEESSQDALRDRREA